MSLLPQELRFAFRRLRRSPRFTLCAAAILSVAIGANITIFAAVDALLLRPLPFPHPEELVVVDQAGFQRDADGTLEIQEWVADSKAFDAIALFNTGTLNLAGDQEQEPVRATQVSSEFFSVIEVEPVFGTVPHTKRIESWRSSVVVISSRFWHRRFGSDPHVLGRVLLLNGRRYTVAAVMPPGFEFPERTALWVPASLRSGLFYGGLVFSFIGRIHEGSSIGGAQAEIDVLADRYFRENPDEHPRRIKLEPLQRELVRDNRASLVALQVGVGFVMLIGFVNIANILMARTTAHRHEIAIRAALGASSSSLVRQPLNEYLVLSAFGWLGGLVVAGLGLGILKSRIPNTLPNYDRIGLSPWVAGMALIAVVTLALLLGSVPGVRSLRLAGPIRSEMLGRSPGSASETPGQRLSAVFAVSQVVMAVILLASSGLLVTSFRRLLQVELGFDPRNAVAFDVLLAGGEHREKLQVDFLDRSLERIRTLPGVVEAGASMRVPLRSPLATVETGSSIVIEGREPASADGEPRARTRFATGGYFRAMGIPRLAGRDFNAGDNPESPPVAIVNEAFAARIWNEQAIGKQLKPDWDETGPWRQVVGVVGSVRSAGPAAEPASVVYFPYQQEPWRVMTIIVRTAGNPETVHEAVRREFRALDPDVPLYNVMTMTESYERWLSDRRALVMAGSFFAGCALFLAALGVYSLFSYVVTLRTREFGIHLALGAQRIDVVGHVLRDATKWLALGIVIGVAAWVGVGRFLEGFLFEVGPADVPTLASVSVVVIIAGLAAAYIPARRGASLDPVVVLRHE